VLLKPLEDMMKIASAPKSLQTILQNMSVIFPIEPNKQKYQPTNSMLESYFNLSVDKQPISFEQYYRLFLQIKQQLKHDSNALVMAKLIRMTNAIEIP